MGRTKKFDTATVLTQLRTVFVTNGFHGTSLDQIVAATGLLRGSLYRTFGSKLGMFIATLQDQLAAPDAEAPWDLLLVAMRDVAPDNQRVFDMLHAWYQTQDTEQLARTLGYALLAHSGLTTGGNTHGNASHDQQ